MIERFSARPLTASYRVQLNARFTLANLRARVEYFVKLGVSHLYLSPILAARRGSMHGYDVVDPTRINPELGTEDDLRQLAADLHAHGLGLIVDIVPNHMGTGAQNPYWDDVLTHGQQSPYARWFDIDWEPRAGARHKLILPILGDELDAVLARGELRVTLHDGDMPRVEYFDNSFPLDPASLPPELDLARADPPEAGELVAAYTSYENTEGRANLRRLLDRQHYALIGWRQGFTELNYRRFFDVNDLAGVRVEDPAVFDATHGFVLGLVAEGVIDGLRIDHIDGLLHPRAYLERLRAALPAGAPVFVEKILSPGEMLRADWPVQGTTGYEFLNAVDDLFIDPGGFRLLDDAYQRVRQMGEDSFDTTADNGKHTVLRTALAADVGRLARGLAALARQAGRQWSLAILNDAIVEHIAALPVYRTYIAPGEPLHLDDRVVIEQALAAVPPAEHTTAVVFIGELMLGEVAGVDPAARLTWVQLLQQVSGPATAKGVEDTALYAYLPLASRNEVGGAPDRVLNDAVDRFHEGNRLRAAHWPLSLLATNTHDTKRSADLRARLAALSELPLEWAAAVRDWRELNARHRRTVDGRSSPDLNTEYLLYQTLIGLWPVDGLALASPARASLVERITAYMIKASREAKMRTSWTDPDAVYEEELRRFVAAIFDPADESDDARRFMSGVGAVAEQTASIGQRNALSRIVLHLTSPGTPDLYQGDELWNFTLVDPDNRQPVDYDRRSSLLADRGESETLTVDATGLARDRTKLLVIQRLLTLRRERPHLFTQGRYTPLVARGPRAANVIAFIRSHDGQHCITIASRLTHSLAVPDGGDLWQGTTLPIPSRLAGVRWTDRLSGAAVGSDDNRLSLSVLLPKLPVALLGN